MATRRKGLPYINVTWLSKLLGGHKCKWAVWFKAHFLFEKFEEMASNLVEWNREHNAMMRLRRQELEEDGWTCHAEADNEFKLKGQTALVVGKPDLIATKPNPSRVRVEDGKTGRERESDIWQVLLYLFGLQKSRTDLVGEVIGEVRYKTGATYTLTPAELSEERMAAIVSLIKEVASDTPPPRVPSRDECKFCNIGPADCPVRVRDVQPVAVGDF